MARHDSGDQPVSSAQPGDPWMPRPAGTSVAEVPGQIELPGYRDFVAIARSEGSVVYRAYQDGVDRPVAVKVLLLDDPEAIARFQRELDITVQLGRQHPHIVTVIDTGTTGDGRPCIVMEHYDRGSLHDRLRARGPLPWEEVLAAGTVVADALSFAHRHGVLHRDVKPQNILVLPTSYVVADFGIARRIDAARTASVEWFSFRHAAPQVLDGDPPAVADDIWSVGSSMFTLLDGKPPFAVGNTAEDTALAYMKRVRIGRPRALNRPDVPPGLVAVIDRCMQHERADRFPDAAALHAALTDLTATTRAWAPPGASGPASSTGSTGSTGAPGATGARSDTTQVRSTGLVAERPPVVRVQPAAMVPQAAPPLPATAMPPPTHAGPSPTGATQVRPPAAPQAGATAPPQAPRPPTASPPAAPQPAAPPPRPAEATGTGRAPTGPSHPTAPTGPSHPTAPTGPSHPTAPPGPQPAAMDGATAQVSGGALSPSAMAHLVASAVQAGSYTVPDEATGYTSGRTMAPPSPAGSPAPRLRRILLGTGIAVLIGGVLGIGGTWVAGLTRGNASNTNQGQSPAPSASAADPGAGPASPATPTATPSNINNTRIAPAITRLDASRTKVLVQWQDRSGGEATFVVVRVRDGRGVPVSTPRAGSTRTVVDGLDPATAPYCFLVIAVLGKERGVSPQRCVEVPA